MIHQKDGKWFVEINRDGFKRVRRSFKLKKDAETFEREYLSPPTGTNAIERQLVTQDSRLLFDLIDLWFTLHGVNLSDGERRKSILVAMAAGMDNPVAYELSPTLFLQYRYRCIYSNHKKVSAKTFNNRHGYLVAVYNTLKKLKIIDYLCPIAEVEFIKTHERQLSYLSLEQIWMLFDCLKNDCRNECVWWIAQLCIRTGARWGEAEQLKRKQLHNCRVTFEFTKSKKVRTVPIDADFFDMLMVFTKGKNPEDRIFKDSITAFNRTIGRSELDFPRGQMTHILRHSFASYFIINGGNILTLQKILGHSDIKMTMRYAHLAPDHLLDAVRLNPMASITANLAVK